MKRNLVIAAVVVVVIAVAAGAAFFLMTPSGPRTVKLDLTEYGFNSPSGGPVIRVKVGEPVKFVLTNRGGNPHEFMIVRDVQGLREALRKTVDELRAKGLDEEDIEESEEVETLRENFIAVKLLMDGNQVGEVELERGQSATVTVTFDRPGTYYYVCAELAGTFPESHADRGMYSTIIVE